MYFTCSQDADELYGKHQEVSVQLELKYNETREARERAAELKERASDMYTSTRTKLDRLTGKDGGGIGRVCWRAVATILPVVKVRGARVAQPPCSHLSPPPCNSMSPLIESIKCYFMPK